jgi:hypothetical protein
MYIGMSSSIWGGFGYIIYKRYWVCGRAYYLICRSYNVSKMYLFSFIWEMGNFSVSENCIQITQKQQSSVLFIVGVNEIVCTAIMLDCNTKECTLAAV